MIFRFSLAVSVLALLGNVVAPPPHPPTPPDQYQNLRNLKRLFSPRSNPHDGAIELQKLQPHHKPESSRSPAPPAPPSLKPTYPLGHDHLTHQTITALKHAEKENLRTSSILHHGANKFTEHCDSAPKHDLHLTAAKYRKAANEHYDAAHHLSSKAKGLESASGQVSVTELQALHHHAKASTAKARSNGEIATNGISYLKGAELANHLHGYETNRGQHAIAQKYKKGSELHYNAAVLSIPELDATQSVHKP